MPGGANQMNITHVNPARDPRINPVAEVPTLPADHTEPPPDLCSTAPAAPSVGRLHYGYSDEAKYIVRRLALANQLEDLIEEFGYAVVLAELERLQP